MIEREWMYEPGRFEVRATVVGSGKTVEKTFPMTEKPSDCYWVGVRIEGENSLDIPVDSAAKTC